MCKRIFKEETSEEGDIPFFKIGTFGGIPDAFISRELFDEYKSKYSYPEPGDILLSASGTIGRIVEYEGEEAYFQDSNIVWLSHDKSVDNKFLKVLYSIVKWDGIEGSTIKRLYNDNFLKTQFMLPSIEEQKKIGSFFEQLDNLITLHQRKPKLLCSSQNFYLVSEYAHPWEQRKLSDIGNIITGSTPSTKDKNNYNGDFLFVSPADIQGNRFVEKTITTLSELGFKKGRILAPKSTLFVSIGSTIGKVAQIRDFAVTNQQINSIEPFKDIDPDFVFSLMQKESPSIRCLSATQAVPILNKTTFSNVEVSIASNINEQYRIGELFIKLDSTITLHQR